MECPKCGRKIEDHVFVNKESDDFNRAHAIAWQASDYKKLGNFDFNKIRNCDVCGKLPSEHAHHCRYCGIAYCRDHVDPGNHACTRLPVPPPRPVLPLKERITGGFFMAVRLIVVLFGIWVLVTGWGIASDNRTGHHVTFPFAGFIVSFIGLVIIVVALYYPRL
jgi:hypothetical protein